MFVTLANVGTVLDGTAAGIEERKRIMNLSEALEIAIGALEVTADKLEKDGALVYETRDTIADTINAALDAAEGGE